MKFSPGIRTASALGLSLLLGACAVGPNYHRPFVEQPTAYKRATPPETQVPHLSKTWWMLFNDPDLTDLALDTIKANQDIQAAIARVDEARAAVRVSRGGLFPSVNLEPSVRRSRSASNTTFSTTETNSSGTPVTVVPNGRIITTYSVPLSLSYEIDIWGRIRRQVEAARFSELASEANLEFVQQTAVSDVAQAYFTIRLYDTQADVYQRSLDLFQRQLDLTRTKYKAGLALQTDVLQAQTQVDSAQSQLIEIKRLRDREEHAIAVLLGRAPTDYSVVAKPLSTAIPSVPAGLPAALLNDRPDVAQAEYNLASANAQIGVAVADFFPSFSLTGSLGYESNSRNDLFSWSNRVWSIGPSANLPIFQGGALTGTLAQRRASYRELVASYRSAVINAYKDVEDELTDLHLLAQKADAINATVADARENARLTEIQYRQGITPYLQVIEADQTLLTNEIAAAQVQVQRLAAAVLLIKALGGGWTAPTAAK